MTDSLPHLTHRRARPTTRLTQGRRTLAHTCILLYTHIRTSVYIFLLYCYLINAVLSPCDPAGNSNNNNNNRHSSW